MSITAALVLVDRLIYTNTGKHLSDLQGAILRGVWQGKKYLEIADEYCCTEGHAKDVASLLWKAISKATGEKVSKNNFRSAIERLILTNPDISFSVDQDLILSTRSNHNFIGRNCAIEYLSSLVDRGSKVIVIQGEGGVGKTTLAQQYLLTQDFELVLELLMAKESQNIISVESVVEEWLKRDLNEEVAGEFGVILIRLKRYLEKHRIGILIDNLEPALDKYGKLITPHRNYVELLRVLADTRVQSTTLITSRDRCCESDLHLEHYRLPGLDEQAWQQFFDSRHIYSDRLTLNLIHKTYGGNAKAMGIICGAIDGDFQGDLQAYWQENQRDPLVEIDLKNLVTSQFDRLRRLDPQAYQLLCRLGCYRYQDIPHIPTEGLICLLGDAITDNPRRIIESLRNRSLVEFSFGKYWLHPVIRAEAIARLKIDGEWEAVNRTIAQFWTDSVDKIETLQDAITALEAYYHYLEIEDFEEAGKVILKSRDNRWGQFLPLGSTLWRMGLWQPIFFAITQIIDRLRSNYHFSELNNILGDLYWTIGKIKEAIATQEKTIHTITQCWHFLDKNNTSKHTIYYLKMLEIDSLLSIGLYQIDLWELEKAAYFFTKVINLAHNTRHQRWTQKASICLALVKSYVNISPELSIIIDNFYHNILADNLGEHTGRFAYFIQIIGQTYYNLGELDKANIMYRKAIDFSQESHYLQVKAKCLTGLAAIERNSQKFDRAYTYHLEAIELLEKIGAKCDLAEAYFQLGITERSRGEKVQSESSFTKAIELFQEIEAPRQIEKVLKLK